LRRNILDLADLHRRSLIGRRLRGAYGLAITVSVMCVKLSDAIRKLSNE
jgi:hypothetical protein